MSVETATYINTLVATNPLSTDARSDGDDHLRLVKQVLKNTFPSIAGAVTATQAELNYSVGVTSGIQAQLDAKAPMPSGTNCLFYQAAAPLGWTQVTTQNDKALRVVSGVGGGSGGSVAFSAAFVSQAISGSVGFHALTVAEMPPHIHYSGYGYQGHGGTADVLVVGNDAPLTNPTSSAGSGNAHNHPFTGNPLNLAVQYINCIIAARN